MRWWHLLLIVIVGCEADDCNKGPTERIIDACARACGENGVAEVSPNADVICRCHGERY
jgi:hypothetical protein